MKPIILFGGTFDPVHNGHVAIAQAAADAFDPQKIIVLPAGNPYQRGRLPFASSKDRVAMLLMAMGLGQTKVVVDKRELNRTGPTYTIDTLQELRSELGETVPLVWLIGSDAFAKLDTWQHWQVLFELTHFAVFKRVGDAPIDSIASADLRAMIKYRSVATDMATEIPTAIPAAMPTKNTAETTAEATTNATTSARVLEPCGKVMWLNVCPPEVSSTQIRTLMQSGETIRGLVPNAVCDYIEQHKLYLNIP